MAYIRDKVSCPTKGCKSVHSVEFEFDFHGGCNDMESQDKTDFLICSECKNEIKISFNIELNVTIDTEISEVTPHFDAQNTETYSNVISENQTSLFT